MLPVVVMVGRPNVGKSTLFNRLTRTQDALVADYPGLTRDRQYGQANYRDKPFIIVDTGGVGVEDMAVDMLMSKQSAMALEEASIVLFVVDTRDGCTAIDKSIANQLRKSGKKVIVVVNKVDDMNSDIACSDFQQLGFPKMYPISAAHGRGMHDLLDELTQDFSVNEPEDVEKEETTRIAFIGRPNVGKSTLINRILGEERVVVYDMPGTTRDSIAIPFARDDKKYTLIDTAGVRRRSRVDEKIEKFSIIKTLQAIKSAHVCLLLIDAQEGLTDQDLHLLGFIVQAGKALVVIVNKWDGLDNDHRDHVKNELSRRLHFVNFAKMRFISALHGSGVGLLFKDIDEAYLSATQRFSTPRLTRLLEDIVTQHQPPLVNGRRIKLRYAHAGGQNPPMIIIHGNQLNALPDSYKRYLMNAFITQLGLIGTPLKFEFKSNTNPFEGRKNKLTERQVKKRRRLMKKVKTKK